MTIEEIKSQSHSGNMRYYLLASPSGIQFMGCLDEIKNPNTPVNWQLCHVVTHNPMSLQDAMDWRQKHELSTDQMNQLESELMSNAPGAT